MPGDDEINLDQLKALKKIFDVRQLPLLQHVAWKTYSPCTSIRLMALLNRNFIMYRMLMRMAAESLTLTSSARSLAPTWVAISPPRTSGSSS